VEDNTIVLLDSIKGPFAASSAVIAKANAMVVAADRARKRENKKILMVVPVDDWIQHKNYSNIACGLKESD